MYSFKQAAHFHAGRLRGQKRVLIVLHDMEVAESATTAEKVAAVFADPRGRVASAHFCCDSDSVVQCVKAGDTAFAAPGANSDGYHIEQAGFARLAKQQWLADPVLNMSSAVAADLVVAFGKFPGIKIPLRRLSVDEIKRGDVSGFAGHLDVTAAYHLSNHVDPGGNFPWDEWMSKVRWWMAQLDTPGYRPRFV